MMIATFIYEEKGFPTIKIFEDHFEIKAIDYWEFKTFRYADIKEVRHYDPLKKWWIQIFFINRHTISYKFSKDSPWTLFIIKNKGANWKYKTSHKRSLEFKQVIKIIRNKLDH
jgi:hypothetical protein